MKEEEEQIVDAFRRINDTIMEPLRAACQAENDTPPGMVYVPVFCLCAIKDQMLHGTTIFSPGALNDGDLKACLQTVLDQMEASDAIRLDRLVQP